MAEIDAKINMSLDEIIKLERKEKKKKPTGVSGKKPQTKRNMKKNIGAANIAGTSRNAGKAFNTKFNKNLKTAAANAIKKRNQTWRFQRRQTANSGFVGKRYKQQNGVTKRTKTGINTKRNTKPLQQTNKNGGVIARRNKNTRFGLTRSRSRNNLVAGALKNNMATNNNRGFKRTNSLPNLRDPNSVHNRLGYQSLTQVAYRNRVKRAKKLLLQRQNKQKQLLADDQMVYRPLRALNTRQQQIMPAQRNMNTSGLRSDQIIRSQRRAQYAQKVMRMNAARMNPNPNINFMCTLDQNWNRPMNYNQNLNRNMSNSNLRQLPRGRSPFRSNMQNSMPRSSQYIRPRSRSRSRSRSRPQPSSSMQSNVNVDDRTFSQVMYSVSNNLGVTGRTLNDRFSF